MTNLKGKEVKTIAVNRRAYHDYHIEQSLEAGIALTGTEIKSIRAGRVNIKEAYAREDKGELWLLNAHIAHYPGGNRYNHEPTRPRKLLLHRGQIQELSRRLRESGWTLVPLRLYIKKNVCKVELGLARGKKLFDKREAIGKREAEREMQRAVKRRVGRK